MPRTHLSCLTREEQRAMLFRTDVLFPWLTAVEWRLYQSQFLDNIPYPERLGELVQCPRHVLRAYISRTQEASVQCKTMNHLVAIATDILGVTLGVHLTEHLEVLFTTACTNAAVPMDPQRCWPKETPEPSEEQNGNASKTLFLNVRAGEQYTLELESDSTDFQLQIHRCWDGATMGEFLVPGEGHNEYPLKRTVQNLLEIIDNTLSLQGLSLEYESVSFAAPEHDQHVVSLWPQRRLNNLLDLIEPDVGEEWDEPGGEVITDLAKGGVITFFFRTVASAQPLSHP